MDKLFTWVMHNMEWLFGGIGVAAIGWFFRGKSNKQIQKSGNNSTNIQIGGNVTNKQDKNDE